MSEIYFANTCKLYWEENFFDFYIESIAFKIKILINITCFNNQQQASVKLNNAVLQSF